MSMIDDPKPPEGYRTLGWIYRNSPVKRKDLVWEVGHNRWVHPKTAPYKPFGVVKNYWYVARKITELEY
jgi:hypothetical protein